jgi:hypothetical protein
MLYGESIKMGDPRCFHFASRQLQLPTKTTFDGTKLPVVMRRLETTSCGMKLLFSADGGQSKSRASESNLVVIDLDTRAIAPEFWLASRQQEH